MTGEEIKEEIMSKVEDWVHDPGYYLNHRYECRQELKELLDKLSGPDFGSILADVEQVKY